MAQTVTQISGRDTLTVEMPKNGERGWLKIKYGRGSDQLWISKSAAQRLRDQLTATLAALDEAGGGKAGEEEGGGDANGGEDGGAGGS